MSDVKPLVVHEYDVDIAGRPLHVVASFWRFPGAGDVWRLEAFDPAGDGYFTALPELAADIPAEKLPAVVADRTQTAGMHRERAGPLLRMAEVCEAQAVMAANLTGLLDDVGAPPPAEPTRTPEPTPPPAVDRPRIRDPAAILTAPGQVHIERGAATRVGPFEAPPGSQP